MSKRLYRCDNKFGDACEYARANRPISSDEVTAPMGGGNPRCPGKTASGKVCGAELIAIRAAGPGWAHMPRIPLPVAGGVAAIVLLGVGAAWLLVPSAPSGSAGLEVLTNPLVFPAAVNGSASTTLEIRNPGTAGLVIEGITATPTTFAPTKNRLELGPGKTTPLFVTFRADSKDLVEGTLELRSNAAGAPTTRVRLIANRNPWWVYDRLDTSSKTLTPRP